MSAPAPPPPSKDAPGVAIHPPILFAALVGAVFVLRYFWPLPLGSGGWGFAVAALGWAMILGGAAYAFAAVGRFRRAGTGIPTFHAATALVSDGVYRYSRNPMYAGMILVFVGVGFVAHTWWALVLLPVMWLVLRYGVIAREEAYMEAKFGQAYRDYKSRVRRGF